MKKILFAILSFCLFYANSYAMNENFIIDSPWFSIDWKIININDDTFSLFESDGTTLITSKQTESFNPTPPEEVFMKVTWDNVMIVFRNQQGFAMWRLFSPQHPAGQIFNGAVRHVWYDGGWVRFDWTWHPTFQYTIWWWSAMCATYPYFTQFWWYYNASWLGGCSWLYDDYDLNDWVNDLIWFIPQSNLVCENIIQEVFSFVDFSPNSAADILETWVNDSWAFVHNIIKTSSWATISFYNVQSLLNYPDWIYTTWLNVEFASDYLFIWEDPSIYLYNPQWISYIKIESSNTFFANIEYFDAWWNPIWEEQWNTDIFNWWVFLNQTAYAVIISFEKSVFTRYIDDIVFWTELINNVSSQLCYDETEDVYEIDWEEYNWPIDWLDSSTWSTIDSSLWSYTTWWYTFIENGFILNNFVPNPYGWMLSFDIVTPSNEIPIRTEEFWSYETDWLWYWFDSWVKVTFPYHQEAWDYRVRVVYKYNWETVYPFWEWFNVYNITLPEVSGIWENELKWSYQACNDGNESEWFLYWVSNFFLCASQYISWWIAAIQEFFWEIREFFRELSNIYTDEEADLMSFFIPSSYAASESPFSSYYASENDWEIENTYLKNRYNIYKNLVYFIFWILWLCVFIYVLNHKND